MDRKWTENGPKMDRKWTENGPKMDRKWTENGPKRDRKGTEKGPKKDQKDLNFPAFFSRSSQTWHLTYQLTIIHLVDALCIVALNNINLLSLRAILSLQKGTKKWPFQLCHKGDTVGSHSMTSA